MVSRDHILVPHLQPVDPIPSDWPDLIARAIAGANALQRTVTLSAWRDITLPEHPQDWPGSAAADRVLWWQADRWLLAIGSIRAATIDGPGRELHLARRTADWRARCVSNDDRQLAIIFLHSFSDQTQNDLPSAWGPWSAGSHVRIPRFFVSHLGNGVGRIGHQTLVEPGDNAADILSELREQPEPVGLLNNAPMPPPSQARPYAELVEEGRSLVELGALRKVVLARSEDLHTDQPIDPWEVLKQLRTDVDPASTAYLCDLPVGGAFIGLTPERLFSLRGKELSTHALAGSRGRGVTPDEDQALADDLLACTKERKEHNLVVEHLQEHLRHRFEGPMTLPKTPSIRQLASVQHLETAMSGQLKNADPWDLLAALHPTPAVCGLPTSASKRIIHRHEHLDRGLYTGAVGWLLGNRAEAIVPLRGGIVAGRQARLFAGAGIVDSSDPEQERHETDLKLGVMHAAIQAALQGTQH
jgi:isochorismate synthase